MALVGAREYIILSTFPAGRGLTRRAEPSRADSYNMTLAVVDHDLVILINRLYVSDALYTYIHARLFAPIKSYRETAMLLSANVSRDSRRPASNNRDVR